MKNNDDAVFAEAVRRRREELGLSQARLSELVRERSGVVLTQQAVARIEAKLRRVTVGEAIGIAAALEDDVDHMISGEVSYHFAIREMSRALDAIGKILKNEELERAFHMALGKKEVS